jgi:hypothetical protein
MQITSDKSFAAALRAIAKNGAALDEAIQNAGLYALSQVAAHGQNGPANRLYLALPRGARKLALSQWFQAFGALVPNSDAATKEAQPFRVAKKKVTDVTAAANTPWYEFKREPHPSEEFDVLQAIVSQLKRAASAEASGKRIVHPEYLARIAAILPKEMRPATATASTGE